MSTFSKSINQKDIISKYFSDPDKKITLKKGDVLLRQNEVNKRLFFVQKGKLSAFLPDEYITEPVFEAHEHSFAGVYSFLSEDHLSYSEVIANEPTEVFYFDRDSRKLTPSESEELSAFLFNIVVLELKSRQHFAARMAHERQEAMNKLIKTEKLITLGQLSAGLAHELNNTIGSLNSNLGQLEDGVFELLSGYRSKKMQGFLEDGLEKGQQRSSSDARKARNGWTEAFKLGSAIIKRLSKSGISPKDVSSKDEAKEAAALWNIGSILHDMKIASDQASHVINSVKSMGIAKQRWSKNVNVNESIGEALAILSNLSKRINLEVALEESMDSIEACHGELVQVWINLIKNAIESLLHHKVKDPKVKISSIVSGKHVVVTVEDNGVGIAPDIMDKIYEPSFTTKVEGISLGLGLGLTIVQRIVSEHNGEIEVSSEPGNTCFKILLPKLKKRKR